ncbi:uncharacterized protein LOC110975986 [Acanthaster planci]|uniref:Uncharacterized protein LOC110975986 n=1 Tax=Acanthaster planci TaxID=133434 RepID=A0A8B7XXQ4_ACAPL|nr:uncharacterized protein LOC110975986 [Acanthaster planci]
MSERSPNYGAFSQFDEAQDTTTIPPISSFAKRNTRLSTSADSEERSRSTGYYRELTLEGMSPNGSASNTSQTPTSPIAMQPQSSQPQQQQQHQGQQRPGSEQQYAKAVAAAVAAAYQAQAQAQEMSGIADGGMVPVPH